MTRDSNINDLYPVSPLWFGGTLQQSYFSFPPRLGPLGFFPRPTAAWLRRLAADYSEIPKQT